MHWCSFCFIKPLHPEWSIFFLKDRCLNHRVRWLERFERSMRIELLWLAIEKSEESLVPNGFTVFTPKFKFNRFLCVSESSEVWWWTFATGRFSLSAVQWRCFLVCSYYCSRKRWFCSRNAPKICWKYFVMIRDDSEVCLNSEVGFLESGIRPIIHL